MLITFISPHIGYDKAAKIVQKASTENISLKESCIKLGYLTTKQFEELMP